MLSDKEKLQKYMTGLDISDERSPITNFPTYSVVYKWTNENLKIYPKGNLENKKILTITGSGDHTLEAIINGANNIDSIDVNVFCKYVTALKIAMIKKYDMPIFYSNYKLFTMALADVKSLLRILDEISTYLSKNEILFWETYINCLKKYRDRKLFIRELFWEDGGLFEKNKYSNESIYSDLKEKLSGVSIKYYDGDIKDIDSILTDRVYDCVYLSNILERINTFNDRTELITKILNKTDKNGTIYNYLFKTFSLFYKYKDLSSLFNIYYDVIKELFDEECFFNYQDDNVFTETMISIIKK